MALDGTYPGLQASVAGFLNRTDLTAAIPDFIALCEAKLERDLVAAGGVRRMIGRDWATISTEFATVPTDFAGVRSFKLDGKKALIYATSDEMADLKWGPAPAGEPHRYCIVGSEFEFYPTPDTDYLAYLTYYKRIPALATNAANWILTSHPGAYLYGSLLQAAPYLKADARIQIWGGLYTDALAGMVNAEKMESFGGAPRQRIRSFG